MRSVSLGGNQPFFQILKEYDIDTLGIADKYKQAAVKWYKLKHCAAMDEVPFTTVQPPKDWNERIELTK